jgi:hypothetical protein
VSQGGQKGKPLLTSRLYKMLFDAGSALEITDLLLVQL